MPSPFRKDQLSPEMVARYGMDRRPTGAWIATGIVVAASLIALAFVGFGITRNPIAYQVIGWDESAADHVDVRFTVDAPTGVSVECAIRAQDRTHVDVGYATVQIAPGQDHIEYPLAILAPSANVEVLGCAQVGALRTTQADFPPGVVPPQQPYAG